MKKILINSTIFILISAFSVFANVKIISIKGNVTIRHGVQQDWVSVAVGDVLRPDDSIKLEKISSAVLLIDEKTKVTLPEATIIDISDLRTLTQEELLLLLAMEHVRSIPPSHNNNDLELPRTTSVHGAKIGEKETISQNKPNDCLLRLNGTKVLYDNGFYATSVLKTKKVFRLCPELNKMINFRLLVANALEKMNLKGEAISEYLNLLNEELTEKQQLSIKRKIEELRKNESN